MGWLRRLLGATPKEELDGIQINTDEPFWELDGGTDFSHLLRAVEDLVPKDSILYFEGGSPNKKLREFFNTHAVPEQTHVAVATLWPKPYYYHVPAAQQNLVQLAELAESCAEPELAVHFHVYRDGKVLLQWHDAPTDSVLLAADLPAEKVKAFAERLSMTITKWKNSVEQEG